MNNNLSLTIKPNKCKVLIGPSGCGKSTLAKLLLGFVQPQETMLWPKLTSWGTIYENEPRAVSFSVS